MQKEAVIMNSGEKKLGLFYLVFSQTLLPFVLAIPLVLFASNITDLWANVLFFAVNFLTVCLIFRKFLWKSLKHLAEHTPGILMSIVVGYFLYRLLFFLLNIGIYTFCPDFFNVNDDQVAQLVSQSYPVMVLCTVVLAPVAEECLYRGVLFGWFVKKSPILAYVLSTLIFALIHVINYIGSYSATTLLICFLQYLPAGLCLGWAYHRTGNIFTPIFIHMLTNAVSIYALR